MIDKGVEVYTPTVAELNEFRKATREPVRRLDDRVMNAELWEEVKKLNSYRLLREKVGPIPEDWWKKDPTLDEVERALCDLKLWGLKLHPLMQGFLINNAALVDPI